MPLQTSFSQQKDFKVVHVMVGGFAEGAPLGFDCSSLAFTGGPCVPQDSATQSRLFHFKQTIALFQSWTFNTTTRRRHSAMQQTL